jgi:hypothetical protein
MQIMLFLELGVTKGLIGIGFRQEHHVMARLVFQPRPKQFDFAEVA